MLKQYIGQFNSKGEVYLRVKASPGSLKNEVKVVMDDDTVKINIKARPEQGRANAELVRFLAKTFQADPKNVKIISGKADRLKLIKLTK